jgi:hypothetical protein
MKYYYFKLKESLFKYGYILELKKDLFVRKSVLMGEDLQLKEEDLEKKKE